MSPKDTVRILSCLVQFVPNREQGDAGQDQMTTPSAVGPMAGLPPLTDPDNLQLFVPKTPLPKAPLLSWGS